MYKWAREEGGRVLVCLAAHPKRLCARPTHPAHIGSSMNRKGEPSQRYQADQGRGVRLLEGDMQHGNVPEEWPPPTTTAGCFPFFLPFSRGRES